MTKDNINLPPITYAPRPPRLRRPPFWMVSLGLVFVVASWLPLVVFARARMINSAVPRVQMLQDMGVQPKFREQQGNSEFADNRADRLPVPGTVARGHLEEDDHYYRGFQSVAGEPDKFTFFDTFPAEVTIDQKLLDRGHQRFDIYCSACHGYDGKGHGAVNERAMELMKTQSDADTHWTPAFDLTSQPVRDRPVGHIYNTINVGIRSMPPYGAQIPVEDRWAIVAYVRALEIVSPPEKPAPATQPVAPTAVLPAAP